MIKNTKIHVHKLNRQDKMHTQHRWEKYMICHTLTTYPNALRSIFIMCSSQVMYVLLYIHDSKKY